MSSASATGRPFTNAVTRRTFVGDMCTYFATARARAGASAAAWLVSAMKCSSASVPQRLRALRSSLMWPRKVRVGANSPSLWPTIESDTNTGTCLRPSCTAIVWPIMSGMMVDRRDQVRITVFLPDSLRASTFLSRWSSTKGPFFRLRGISYLPAQCGIVRSRVHSPLLAGTAPADDQLVGRLGAAGAALGLARGIDRVATTGGLALTTTVRVVDRVHRDTADGGALALPPHAARLAPVDVAVLGVAHLADGRAAADVDVADLAGRHAQLRVRAVLGHELHTRAGRAGDLGAASGAELDRVHHGAGGDVAQRQVVPDLDVGPRTGLDPVALPQPRRRDDVALLAVRVVQQRDPAGAVRVVLDVRDLGRHTVLVVAPEVDQPVRPLVTAALVAGGHLAVDVAA